MPPRTKFALATVLLAGLAVQGVASQLPASTPAATSSDANSARSEAVERLALRIVNTPAVKAAKARGLIRYQTSATAAMPQGARYARSAIDEAATQSALYAAMTTIPEPTFTWVYAPPHRWHGYTIGGSRWYADNPDTMYRAVRIEHGSTYEITVRPGPVLPAQLSIMMYDFVLHEHGVTARSDVPVGTMDITADTPRNPDGSITVTVGPDPAAGRINYIQTKPQVEQILIREIRGDWTLPMVRLGIRRTSGPAPKKATVDELSRLAAHYIDTAVDATLNIDKIFGQRFDNLVSPLRVRWIEETGSQAQKTIMDEPLGPDRVLGFLGSSRYNLKDDEALILTLDMMGTRYLSVGTYRPFFLTPDHVGHTSSLNNYQTKANPDGTITFVIAPRDPGVYNWLDTGGNPYGSVSMRWQALTRPVVGNNANGVKTVKVVKIADLRKELPATTKWVTPGERAAQRAERSRLYHLRCLGTPCEVGGKLDRPY